MEEPWDFEFLSRIVDGFVSFLSEFVDDWLANDMRVSIFKILFSWLVVSLIAIHFAWRVYGNTVNDMYYRQGTSGQNGGTPDTAPHRSGWESAAGDTIKTHRHRLHQRPDTTMGIGGISRMCTSITLVPINPGRSSHCRPDRCEKVKESLLMRMPSVSSPCARGSSPSPASMTAPAASVGRPDHLSHHSGTGDPSEGVPCLPAPAPLAGLTLGSAHHAPYLSTAQWALPQPADGGSPALPTPSTCMARTNPNSPRPSRAPASESQQATQEGARHGSRESEPVDHKGETDCTSPHTTGDSTTGRNPSSPTRHPAHSRAMLLEPITALRTNATLSDCSPASSHRGPA